MQFGSKPYWALQEQAFARRASALTKDGAVLVAVQIEPAGVGIRTRCRPSSCGPFLSRLVHDTVAVNTWNAFLASHRSGRIHSISIRGLVCHTRKSPCDDRMTNGQLARPDGTHYQEPASQAVAQAVIRQALTAAGLPR